jgi:hypothetical protein
MTRRCARALFGLVFVAFAAGGCQLLVGSDVPEFRCTGDSASSCPSGTACDVSLGRCVAGAIPPEAGGDIGAPDVDEGGRDADGGPLALGEPCRVDVDCQSDLCGTSTILTTTITQSAGPICTKTCCTSADCPSMFVCFGGGTGGNYCVPAEKAKRAPPATGGRSPGSNCDENGDCRSGLCEGSRCLDTCCHPGDCAGDTICRIKSVSAPAPAHNVWVCARPEASGVKDPGATCSDNFECKSDNCVGFPERRCSPPCCSPQSCAAQGFASRCGYGSSGSDQLKWCFFGDGGGALPLDAACEDNFNCASDYCDADLKKCAQVCCVDTDCPASQECRPSPVGTPFLRCVAR